VRKLRIIRIVLATFFLLAVTACFLDFTGTAAKWFGWTVKIQLMPAALALSLAAVAILCVTLLFGRIYCSIVCPLGILQDIAFFFRRVAGRLVPSRGGALRTARHAMLRNVFRYAVAIVFLAGGFLGLHFTWLEPYAIYGRMATGLAAPLVRLGNNHLAAWAERHGSYAFHVVEVVAPPLCLVILSAALLVLILALAVWKGRFWCNTVCPVGTVLGCLSKVSLLKPKIDLAKCVKCGMCERACKAQSIDIASGTIDRTTCVACFDCGAVCKKGALTWSR
jgi:polyferredoxin